MQVAGLNSLCPLEKATTFLGKIDYRMFMQLMWTTYDLNVPNLSECWYLNEVWIMKLCPQMSGLLLVKVNKSWLAC